MDTLDAIYQIFDSIKPNENGCMIWPGRWRQPNDYSQVRVNAIRHKVHRLALERKLGRPIGLDSNGFQLLVLHRCDVPRCVNPEHLYEGTHLNNVRDMYLKDRQPPQNRKG